MGKIKELKQLNQDLKKFVASWDCFYHSLIHEDTEETELIINDFAIPDEQHHNQTVSFDALQKYCAKKSRDGFTEGIRKIIQSHNVDRLSDIDPKYYSKIWQEVDALV